MTTEQLRSKRLKLDIIDENIIRLLAQRNRIAHQVAKIKKSSLAAIRDPQREYALLKRLSRIAIKAGIDSYFVTKLYRHILDYSLALQEHSISIESSLDSCVVACPGGEGTYSSLATREFFSPHEVKLQLIGQKSFKDVLTTVQEGHAQYGVIPIENSISGAIGESYDLLGQSDLKIVGEHILPIEHCLVAAHNVPLKNISKILSHPQAFLQCSHFLSTLSKCQLEPFSDTAAAAEKVATEGDLTQAAIASQYAAEQHGLYVLKRGIANQKDNFTRFLVMAIQSESVDARIPCKTSIMLTADDNKDSLSNVLAILTEAHFPIVGIEKRPRQQFPWQQMYYIDFDGNLANEPTQEAIQQMASKVASLRVLGSYPHCIEKRRH